MYKKARIKNTQYHWDKFRTIRNETTNLIRESKKLYYANIADKLKTSELSSKDWWKTLKTFLNPLEHSSVPVLHYNGNDAEDDQSQTAIAIEEMQSRSLTDRNMNQDEMVSAEDLEEAENELSKQRRRVKRGSRTLA